MRKFVFYYTSEERKAKENSQKKGMAFDDSPEIVTIRVVRLSRPGIRRNNPLDTSALRAAPNPSTRSAHLWYTAREIFALGDARRERYISCPRLFTFPTALGATGRFSLSNNGGRRPEGGWCRLEWGCRYWCWVNPFFVVVEVC